MLGSFPTEDPDGWAVEVLDGPGAPRIEITATAVCLRAKRSSILTLVSPTVLLKRQDADATSVLAPRAPRSSAAASGSSPTS